MVRVNILERNAMRTSASIGQLAKALATANTHITNPKLDSVNPHFRNRYASLGAILNAVRIPLASNGLALVQTINTDNNMVAVETTMTHVSGEWMAETVAMPFPDRGTVQQLGSLVTYLRRYSAAAMCGIVGEEDDDGEQDRQAPREAQRPAAAPQAAPKAAPAPRPIATVDAPATPAKATTPPADEYPDEFEGEVTILRVAERKGKPIAIQFDGPHGKAWMTTDVMEYAQFAKDDIDQTARVHLARVNGALTIMRWQAPTPAPTTELPF
jgi:hypothetical protein